MIPIKKDMMKHMRSSKVSGMTQIILYLAKQTSRKTLGFTPSMREVCTKGEGFGT